MDGGWNMALDEAGANRARVSGALSGPRTPECGSHSGRSWYCLQTERRREAEVRDRLEDQGFGAFLPLIIAMRAVRPGVMQAAAVAAFPGYLFVSFDVQADRWRSIVYTRGVRGLFSTAPERPIRVARNVIDTLIAAGYDRPIVEDPRPALIEAGVRLRLIDGPFADQQGICLFDDGKRVRMLMDLLGGEREIAVPRPAVARVS
jgi:transcription antitermination factor NusG